MAVYQASLTEVPAYRCAIVREGSQLVSERETLTRHEQAHAILAPLFDGADREMMVCLLLDSQSRPIGTNLVSVGTLNTTLCGSREIARAAILTNAASVILAHNHPSGDPEPSPEDIKVTKEVKTALLMFDVHLLDHLVIGEAGKYASMSERGLL